ncbi:four helix bundle protein [Candidatus Falkowbacteria bacterium]|jgi:four helix bundle protein|nr:four helix bundle protein [Candidatus Falkowbacteria bacterium]MBT5502745.1 four helix bundle protein [Candidatus Falkowbacteria bacterium]MBT6573471.1 four helix bundle protein [Candidatus Falkowbacteria bacterium]MBT7501144.1 four helix bundle protein [Candidatus Falkowbacteria bacterium]
MGVSFKELRVWQKGNKLLLQIYELTADFPKEEKFSLTQQLRRAANSIIANIAECHGRFHFKDKIRVLYIARGELEETRSHLLVSFQLNYVSEEVYQELEKEYAGLLIGINEFILNYKKRIN